MRVISGHFARMRLGYPKTNKLRPTKDQVKEALFNILQQRVAGAFVLDLFAGTGSLGIEAISRLAAHVTFVDTHTDYLVKNVEKLKTMVKNDNALAIASDARVVAPVPQQHLCTVAIHKKTSRQFLLSNRKNYDIIFLDPPWTDCDLYDASLKTISKLAILRPQGIIAIEHPESYKMTLDLFKKKATSYRYGKTMLTLVKT